MTASGALRRNWRLKIAALVLAILLWATVRVDAVSRQDLPDVEVRVENFDPNWFVQGMPSPATVQVSVTGPARDLFRVAVDRPIIVIPIDRVFGEDSVLALRTDWVRNADRPGVVIEDFIPSTVRLEFERNKVESIPVSYRLTGAVPDSLAMVANPRVNPLFTQVRGPAGTVDGLETVFLAPFDLGRITSSGRFDVSLDTTGLSGVAVNPSTATLTVTVAPRVDLVLAPRPVDLPEGEDGLLVEPALLPVTLSGAAPTLAATDTTAIRVHVLMDAAVAQLAVGESIRVPVAVSGLPQWVEGAAAADSVDVRRIGPP